MMRLAQMTPAQPEPTRSRGAWTAAAVVGLAVTLGGQPTEVVLETPMAPAFQAALEQWDATFGHYGVSAAVILADGTRWEGAAGRARDDVLTPEHHPGRQHHQDDDSGRDPAARR
jgi:hypothetical protein